MTISPSDILLKNRVAVLTGGGAGIGRGIAAFGALGIVTDVRDSIRANRRRARAGNDPGEQRRWRVLLGVLDTSENG